MSDRGQFPVALLGTDGGIADLSARAKFELTGADRVRFLNGQVSNDVRKISECETIHACVLTAKGKMCGDIFISAGANSLRCDAEPALRESLAARLDRYIISDDVALRDVSDELRLLHVMGTLASDSDFSGGASNRFGTPGRDLFLDRTSFERLWPSFSTKFTVLDEEKLELLRISAGLPRWGFELNEDTIPVEAGLQKTAIDYEKGCYVGQEIISRLKSIGHVNKTLRGFVGRGAEPLQQGARLFASGTSEKEAGRLTSTAFSLTLEKSIALGYLKRGELRTTYHARAADTEWIVDLAEFPICL